MHLSECVCVYVWCVCVCVQYLINSPRQFTDRVTVEAVYLGPYNNKDTTSSNSKVATRWSACITQGYNLSILIMS